MKDERPGKARVLNPRPERSGMTRWQDLGKEVRPADDGPRPQGRQRLLAR